MELLKPAHPSHESLSGFSSNGVLHAAGLALLPNIAEEGSSSNNTGNNNIMNTRGEVKVHVAVGKSVEKAESLLLWCFKHFGCTEICLLYVHQPSPLIPTLLGKLPASRANAEVLAAYRREEREQMKMIVENYLSICHKAKVIAGIISTDCDQVQKGIVELVNRLHVRKLVMWSEADTCMKVSKSSSKAHYVAKNAPLFCNIWFVNKGKHVWTREASEITSPLPPEMISSSPRATATLWRTKSSQSSKSKLPFYQEFQRSSSAISIACSGISDWVQSESSYAETISHTISGASNRYFHRSSVSPTSASISSENSSAKRRESSDSDVNFDEESLNFSLEEMRMEAKASRNKAFEELLRRKKLEIEAMEAISKIKNFEFALAHEFQLKKEAEDAMRNAMQEQEKFFKEREEASRELNRTMRNVALLDSRAQEANRRRDAAAEELKVIQANISSLRLEKQRIRQQKMEAVHWLERWRRHGESGAANCNDFLGFVEKLPELAEFSLSDLQTATCDFSESFKLGQGGYGCVYKGEMLGRTVAIKKLHAHNMQGQSEFQKEVQVLGKLQHRHLVTLLGACPEAWSLVYEYLPKGSLHDRLFQKSNVSPLTWKIRARIIAEISSALCFLHSSKPEKIVHGDLKPQNILLDSKLSCKICEFGICRLVAEDTFYCPSFRRNTEPTGAFPYTDPEVQRIGVLTPKSDIYSFGVIVLQLLTGRSAVGLVGEVRRTMSCGNLVSILDHSAGEWPMFVARRLADLGLQFSELSSRERPDLTPALVREMEQLHVSEERPVPSFFLCPIRQEIMHDPQVASDGFTYEGEAMRGWLEKGRETSPMTNLKLSHLHLTPNHALRLAIQDWLCRS